MKEKIEKKLEEHINKILKKNDLDFTDYQILSSELCKLELAEKNKKLEEEQSKRTAMLRNSFESLIG